MKILPISDVHLEFSHLPLYNTDGADVLVICGDLLIAHDLYYLAKRPMMPSPIGKRWGRGMRYREFLSQITSEFEHILYVPGNHEYYHGRWTQVPDWIRAECIRYPSIKVLNNQWIELNGVTFIGGTMWTDMNRHDNQVLYQLPKLLNDYRYIRNDAYNYRRLTVLDVAIAHKAFLSFLTSTLNSLRHASLSNDIVVITHHAPTYHSITPSFGPLDVEIHGYASDLSALIESYPEITTWLHGHIHSASKYQIHNTTIACNPRGYHDNQNCEYTGWNPQLVIEI